MKVYAWLIDLFCYMFKALSPRQQEISKALVLSIAYASSIGGKYTTPIVATSRFLIPFRIDSTFAIREFVLQPNYPTNPNIGNSVTGMATLTGTLTNVVFIGAFQEYEHSMSVLMCRGCLRPYSPLWRASRRHWWYMCYCSYFADLFHRQYTSSAANEAVTYASFSFFAFPTMILCLVVAWASLTVQFFVVP